MDNKEVELDNGLTEKGLIDFVKTVLLSGDNPRGEEALNNLKWGIKQYRKHLILPVVGVTLPDFLYEDKGLIRIGYHGDSVVNDEWEEWLKNR